MATKVAINGFGRIGRLALREMLRNAPELEVVAINDLTDNKDLLYLLKYDTAQGAFPYEVSLKGDSLIVEGHEIRCYAEKNAADLPWNWAWTSFWSAPDSIPRKKNHRPIWMPAQSVF